MATLTPTITLSSTDLSTDTLSVNLTDSLSVLGEVHIIRKKLSTTAALILDASEHNKCYVLLNNTSTASAEIVTIEESEGGQEHMFLGAGEWAWFPWASAVDLLADSASGTPTLEVMIFEATA